MSASIAETFYFLRFADSIENNIFFFWWSDFFSANNLSTKLWISKFVKCRLFCFNYSEKTITKFKMRLFYLTHALNYITFLSPIKITNWMITRNYVVWV